MQEPKQHEPQTQDLGIALNDYLLGRLPLSEGDTLYESTRASLRRRADSRPVDIYEMVLGGSVAARQGRPERAVVALPVVLPRQHAGCRRRRPGFTQREGGRAWRLLERLHAWMAWLMKVPIAVLQFCMLVVVVFGAVGLVAPALQSRAGCRRVRGGPLVPVALAVIRWLRGTPGPARVGVTAFLLVAVPATLAAAVFSLRAEEWVANVFRGRRFAVPCPVRISSSAIPPSRKACAGSASSWSWRRSYGGRRRPGIVAR